MEWMESGTELIADSLCRYLLFSLFYQPQITGIFVANLYSANFEIKRAGNVRRYERNG